jgi:hypothetical protein
MGMKDSVAVQFNEATSRSAVQELHEQASVEQPPGRVFEALLVRLSECG